MSRENKKASGKQWNRSGPGKKIPRPGRKRMPRIFSKCPKIESRDWLESVGIDRDVEEISPEERVISYVFGDDVDSDTAVVEEESSGEVGWLTRLLDEMRNEPEVLPRRVCPETMKLEVASGSDIGCHREKNEDSVYVNEELGLFIVCDGMGGHLAGEIASRKAIEYTVDFLTQARNRRILPEVTDTDFREVWSELMVEAIDHCCEQVHAFAQSNPELDGMATTITALMIVDGYAFVGHLGDSRLYLNHGDVVKQLTIDHTLLNDILRSNPDSVNAEKDPGALNRFKHVLTKCVGRESGEFEPDSFSFPLVEDDVLLICSDGLSNYFEDETQLVRLLEDEDPSGIVKTMIHFARFAGGSDNISAVVVRVGHNEESGSLFDDTETEEFDRLGDTKKFTPASLN